MPNVFLTRRTGHQKIIYIVKAETLKATQNLIHEPLEGLSLAEGHAEEFEEAEWSNDGCLGHIIRFHGDLMVCADEVDLAENSGAMQRCREVLYVGNGIAIGDGVRVQGTIVTTGPPVTGGLFGYHVQWRGPTA